jgi:hypothetical protein
LTIKSTEDNEKWCKIKPLSPSNHCEASLTTVSIVAALYEQYASHAFNSVRTNWS